MRVISVCCKVPTPQPRTQTSFSNCVGGLNLHCPLTVAISHMWLFKLLK